MFKQCFEIGPKDGQLLEMDSFTPFLLLFLPCLYITLTLHILYPVVGHRPKLFPFTLPLTRNLVLTTPCPYPSPTLALHPSRTCLSILILPATLFTPFIPS